MFEITTFYFQHSFMIISTAKLNVYENKKVLVNTILRKNLYEKILHLWSLLLMNWFCPLDFKEFIFN